jgi:hypothetical protein
MDKMGQSLRILCDAKCILIFEGFDYHGIIENVSLSGALIKLKDDIPDNLRTEDRCDLMLCGDPGLYPVKYTCNVIRIDSTAIGVKFIELNLS